MYIHFGTPRLNAVLLPKMLLSLIAIMRTITNYPENNTHVIAAFEEFEKEVDQDDPDNDNPFQDTYLHMDVIDADSDGSDYKDSYN
jgi:hypothetical protein